MNEWFASGRVIDAILLLVALEFLLLAALRRRTGPGLAPAAMVWNLLAGTGLLLALRGALTGSGWPWIAGWLVTGLLAHAADLATRSRGQ